MEQNQALLDMDDTELSMRRVQLGRVYLVPSVDGGVTLRGARTTAALRGSLVTDVFPRLIPKLAEQPTFGEVLDELAATTPRAEIAAALKQLISIDVIEFVPSETSPQLETISRFLGRYGSTRAVETLARGTILIAGEGPVLPSLGAEIAALGVARLTLAVRGEVSRALKGQSAYLAAADLGTPMVDVVRAVVARVAPQVEIRIADTFPLDKLGWEAVLAESDAAVVAMDAPTVSVPWLDEFNKAALAANTRWTSGTLLDRQFVQLGPSVVPRRTPCWKCYETRFKSNMGSVPRYEEFQRYLADHADYVDQGAVPAFADYVGPLLAVETLRLMGGDELSAGALGTLVTFSLWDYSMERHTVLKLPRCPHCSPIANVPQERVWS